jgi:hypothetical protein
MVDCLRHPTFIISNRVLLSHFKFFHISEFKRSNRPVDTDTQLQVTSHHESLHRSSCHCRVRSPRCTVLAVYHNRRWNYKLRKREALPSPKAGSQKKVGGPAYLASIILSTLTINYASTAITLTRTIFFRNANC